MSNHKHINLNNRRNFLRKMVGAGCSALTLNPFLSTLTNLGLMNASAAANRPIYSCDGSDYKALVCIMLVGGNDSFNMLVPYDQLQYNAYEDLRGGVHDPDRDSTTHNLTGMALDRSELNELYPVNTSDLMGRQFGLHPKMSKIRHLFNGTDPDNLTNPVDNYISFVANVGTLVEPITSTTDYNNKLKPKQLFSHLNQKLAWQTGVAEGNISTGWAGRTADILNSCNNYQDISMNIALNGLNIFQRGENVKEYVIQSTGNGSIPLIDNFIEDREFSGDNFYYATRDASIDNIMAAGHQNILEKAYAGKVRKALKNSDNFNLAINDFDINGNTNFSHEFPETPIGNQLQMIARSIATRNSLGGIGGIRRQTFFVAMSGFDNHNGLIVEHENLMEQLDEAIYAFYKAMKELEDHNNDTDISKKVTGFTMSDFARTLGSNGNGSDHAWGGHHLVFGGAVNGGRIFGEYPDLTGNNIDLGRGRFIPKISCDEYFADLALWFGHNGTSTLTSTDLQDILPNICNFYTSCNNAFTNRLGLFA